MHINTRLSTHSGKLERWLGKEKLENLQASLRGWYGDPLAVVDLPGCVKIDGHGDFHGTLTRGAWLSAMDDLELRLKAFLKVPQFQAAAGFTSVGDALARASQGFGQTRNFQKVGSAGVASVSSSLWRAGPQPASGAAPAAAPGGTAYSSATTGALAFANPSVGTNRLVGADISGNVVGNSLLIYDLIFGVAKTMNSTAAEAVTGVPTRYQSTVATNEDYCGSNFLFVQVGGTALAATAHNWTVCTYLDQDNAASTLPSLTGNSSAIVDRFDHPVVQWFAPLASGDTGIKALTQMQCSAAVATGVVWFMIGHPLGVCSVPLANYLVPYDWITNRNQAPRVFDNACIAFLEMVKPSTATATYTGSLYTTSTSS